MNSPLAQLSTEEKDGLFFIPVWVSVLVASSDIVFTKKEITSAVKLTGEKQREDEKFIVEFFKTVSKKFEVNLKGYIALITKDLAKKSEFLFNKITNINDLFKKTEIKYAQQLYLSFSDFAYNLVQVFGGLFGLLSAFFAKSKCKDLNMIEKLIVVGT
jgi:hypothetical protein